MYTVIPQIITKRTLQKGIIKISVVILKWKMERIQKPNRK